MGILLFVVALVLGIVLGIVSLPFSIGIIFIESLKKAKIKSKFGWKFIFYLIDRMYTDLNKVFFAGAISIDQFGNVFLQHLFNWALIKKGFYEASTNKGLRSATYKENKSRFGNPDETISSVIGKNKRQFSLTKTGKGLSWLLDTLDHNHSLKSIEQDD